MKDGNHVINLETQETVTATIRTNGGSLIVNAPRAIFNHYSSTMSVDVMDIFVNSYHEHGNVEDIFLFHRDMSFLKKNICCLNNICLEFEHSINL